MDNNWYCEVESLEEMRQVESLFRELGGEIRCLNSCLLRFSGFKCSNVSSFYLRCTDEE